MQFVLIYSPFETFIINVKNLVIKLGLQSVKPCVVFPPGKKPAELHFQDVKSQQSREIKGKKPPSVTQQNLGTQPGSLHSHSVLSRLEKYLHKLGKGSRAGEPAHGEQLKRVQLFLQQKRWAGGGCPGKVSAHEVSFLSLKEVEAGVHGLE